MGTCFACKIFTEPSRGEVDIGGLKLCPPCYAYRSSRDTMSCEVCNKLVSITPNPLITSQICPQCNQEANLTKAWDDAKNHKPCDRCKGIADPHHPTTYGQNLCHDCYKRDGACTQLYPGDRGYPAFTGKTHRPSLPVAVLPYQENSPQSCIVCHRHVSDHAGLVEHFGLAAVCMGCVGPTHWDYMHEHYDDMIPKNVKKEIRLSEEPTQETWRDRPPLL